MLGCLSKVQIQRFLSYSPVFFQKTDQNASVEQASGFNIGNLSQVSGQIILC